MRRPMLKVTTYQTRRVKAIGSKLMVTLTLILNNLRILGLMFLPRLTLMQLRSVEEMELVQ